MLAEHHVGAVLLGAAGRDDHRARAGAQTGGDFGPGEFLDEHGIGAGPGVRRGLDRLRRRGPPGGGRAEAGESEEERQESGRSEHGGSAGMYKTR